MHNKSCLYKINDKKVILKEGKFLRFVKKGRWEFVERVKCSGAVIILALTDEDKVIFIEQFRPAVGRRVVEFPAGLIDMKHGKKESFQAAAKRELFEETGYQAKKIKKIIYGPAASGVSSEMMMVVHAIGLKKVGIGGGDALESIKIYEVPIKSAEKWLKGMERKGRYVGTRIYSGLYFLNKYNMSQRKKVK